MAYESRIYIINVKEIEFPGGSIFHHVENIAGINMRCMEIGFRDIFTEIIKGDLFSLDGKELISEDCYGNEVEAAEISTVIEWLENQITKDNYRRLNPLLNLLKGFNTEEWEHLLVVHFGY